MFIILGLFKNMKCLSPIVFLFQVSFCVLKEYDKVLLTGFLVSVFINILSLFLCYMRSLFRDIVCLLLLCI